ncbi:MAG: radical SAM protein [Lachnospiraceae bacterium]|nr:radical SAM protein [Lachnospiraceae bacterium]
MFFKRKSNVMYREYDSFGYITDNRNFEYKYANQRKSSIGDRIVSKSGAIFLSVLDIVPQPIEDLVDKISLEFVGVDKKTICEDSLELYFLLEKEGFVVSGNTYDECEQNDILIPKGNEVYSKDLRLEEECEKTTQYYFDNYLDGKPQLLSLHMEIISICNERCIHCYIPHESKTSSMSPEMFFDVLEQGRKMNILNVILSGGEPMAHTHFIDFLRKCYEYNISVNILSNLTLLNEDILNEMKRNPLICVQTSLYAVDSDIHDSITQKKGSYNQTISGIFKLIDNNIPVQVSCPIMKQNINCYKEVIEWGRKNNVNVNSDYVIIGRYDSSTQNLECRLTLNEVRNIIEDNISCDENYRRALGDTYIKNSNSKLDDFVCSVCSSSICISENGNVYPCAGWQGYVVGNITERSLKDIWYNSPRVNYLRNLRKKDFTACMECSDKEFCTMCMVRNSNESLLGEPLEVNQYFCDIAKINKELYFAKKEE